MTDMELKEVIQQILPHYERALIEMPKEGHYEWLEEKYMDVGLCRFSFFALHKYIAPEIKPFVNSDSMYIGGDFPEPYYTHQENLKQIQNRVDWMREYLSKN